MTIDAKICGITDAGAMAAAVDGGARWVGLVFYPKSPRNVSLAQADALAETARGRVRVVALTVDADDDSLADIVAAVRPDVLQMHGKETVDRVAAVKARFGLPVIKAVGVATRADAAAAAAYFKVADLMLFDAPAPPGARLPGGNGLTFDWRALDGVPAGLGFMLSGGLSPQNVAEAIRLTRASAVDVSSGVESAPGVKDPVLIRRFLQAVKTAKGATTNS